MKTILAILAAALTGCATSYNHPLPTQSTDEAIKAMMAPIK